MSDTIWKDSRRTYTKPLVKRVELIAEEAVLAGCKLNSSTSGPGDWKGKCTNPGGQRQCNATTS